MIREIVLKYFYKCAYSNNPASLGRILNTLGVEDFYTQIAPKGSNLRKNASIGPSQTC